MDTMHLSRRDLGIAFALAPLAVALLAGTTLAFAISNAGFYAFSGYFPEMSWGEYATRVAKYFPSYLASAVSYVAAALGAQALAAIAARAGERQTPGRL